jgi:alpha-glucosidase
MKFEITSSRYARSMTLVLLCALTPYGWAKPSSAGKPIVVTSPDKRVKAELNANSGALSYRVLVDGKQVLAPSRIGILTDAGELGQAVSLQSPHLHAVNERYAFFGGHSVAINHANEATIPATSHGESYFVDIHVANDGVGVRMRLPAKPGRKVLADRSSWALEGDPTMWVDKLDNSYESPYVTSSLDKLTGALGMPVTARVGDLYVTVTEAAVKDYGDLGLKRGDDGALEGQLYADPQGWSTDDAVVQPWRVTIVARDLNALVNTTLVQNLNPPPSAELAKANWIRPGRSSWQWLAIGDPHQDDQQQWVDWTAQLGFEYYLIDEGWANWKDGWTTVKATEEYAKSKNVKIWIWVHSKDVRDPEARQALFKKAADAGIVGVKVDFPRPSNRWWATWYYDTARDAAASHLMIDFHGASKPTGMERTWPNVLTREGVRGHEYQITRYKRHLDPEHDVILPFTRYIAGAGDYTPTVFESKELKGNTWGHELAQAVIFTSPYLCYGGHPRDFLENPARDVLTAIPSVWDETRVLPGSEPGKVVAMARRSGGRWFIAAINGADPVTLDIPLSFLGKGTWKATELFDAEAKPDQWDRRSANLSGGDHLRLQLSSRGGFVGMIVQ